MFYAISVMREERWDGERGRVGAWNDHERRGCYLDQLEDRYRGESWGCVQRLQPP